MRKLLMMGNAVEMLRSLKRNGKALPVFHELNFLCRQKHTHGVSFLVSSLMTVNTLLRILKTLDTAMFFFQSPSP